MSGIYLHIPFCKQACHYCDFHFSTSVKSKQEMVHALCKEIVLRKDEVKGPVKTIYFGGGTPSLLSPEELQQIFKAIYKNFTVLKNAEITLEANPDDLWNESQNTAKNVSLSEVEDLMETRLALIKKSGVNRLSIGVQSFFEEDLKLMNRAHNASEAKECIVAAKRYFKNISIDLIYGIPGMSIERWRENLTIALQLAIPHLSCYALTVEPKTALKKFIERGIIAPVDEEVAKEHYEILLAETEKGGYENYEFSNFGKQGFHSKNNTAYWEGAPYLGIGPSAHSYDGNSRSWNIANNSLYIKNIEDGTLPSKKEILSLKDKYNEYIMTGLRTKKGISLQKVESEFGGNYKEYLLKQAENNLKNGFLYCENETIKIAKKGKLLSDGIASDLFMI